MEGIWCSSEVLHRSGQGLSRSAAAAGSGSIGALLSFLGRVLICCPSPRCCGWSEVERGAWSSLDPVGRRSAGKEETAVMLALQI